MRSMVTDMMRFKNPAATRASPWAVRRDRSGTMVKHSAPINPVGRASRGMVMPHRTPKADMAAPDSIPPSTSLAGMSTALAEPKMVPSTEVRPTGMAMDHRPFATDGSRARPRGRVR